MSDHWYTKEGKPMYQVPKKDGTMRNTTLADARKLKLVHSVSAVLNIPSKDMLINKKIEKILLTANKMPRYKEGQDIKTYVNKITAVALKEWDKARDLGSKIHYELSHFINNPNDTYELGIFIEPIIKKIMQRGLALGISEYSFSHPTGFAGQVDFYDLGQKVIVDFKCKDFDENKKIFIPEQHLMQLAAYRQGLVESISVDMSRATCENWYISTSVPGLIVEHKWTEEELDKGWNMFYHLNEYWKLLNNYDDKV